MKDEYPGIDHPKSLSVREDHLLPTIDGWLAHLFNDDHIDETVKTLASVEHDELNTAELLEARRTIKDCDKRIGNLEIACETTNDADTIAGFAQRIERIGAKRKGAEIRLRRLTIGRGMTQEEIREVVNNLTDAVALLTNATPEDRRRVYEAAQLEILYDH
jgi:site-specific DNA recombinase